MTHSKRCILASHCAERDTPTCAPLCHAYIAMHGMSGEGGRHGAAAVPPDYRQVTVENSPARTKQSAAYEPVDAYIKTFPRQFDEGAAPIKSLYLYSRSPGTGKTTTAAAILNEWLTVHYIGSVQRNRQALDRPAYFLDVNAWQELYNEFNRPKVPESIATPASERYYREMYAAMSVPFAVLDDIGVREATDGFRGDLHKIINARVTSGLPTVYTSNVTVAELALIYDARLADRVRDLCMEIPFVGESNRGWRK